MENEVLSTKRKALADLYNCTYFLWIKPETVRNKETQSIVEEILKLNISLRENDDIEEKEALVNMSDFIHDEIATAVAENKLDVVEFLTKFDNYIERVYN